MANQRAGYGGDDPTPANPWPGPRSSGSLDRRCAKRSTVGPVRRFCRMLRSGFPSNTSRRRVIQCPNSGATEVSSFPDASRSPSGILPSTAGSARSRLRARSRVRSAAQSPISSGRIVRWFWPRYSSARARQAPTERGMARSSFSRQSRRTFIGLWGSGL